MRGRPRRRRRRGWGTLLGSVSGSLLLYEGAELKSPHVGWNSLEKIRTDSRLLRAWRMAAFVYYTHSWRAPVSSDTAAVTSYGGEFTAAVESGECDGGAVPSGEVG